MSKFNPDNYSAESSFLDIEGTSATKPIQSADVSSNNFIVDSELKIEIPDLATQNKKFDTKP